MRCWRSQSIMENFVLYNPVRILFGKGQTANIDGQLPKDARVLVTYGSGSILRNGVLNEVRTALGTRHVVLFGGIEPNPHYETLIKALPVIEREGINFLLAVGGGSVIDGTKFIAAAACFPGEDKWDLIRHREEHPVQAALPLGTVLTISATGSEMNSAAVVSKAETQEKFGLHSDLLFPQFSVVDPAHTLSLPMRQVANGVVDAFVHVVEQYLTFPVGAMVQDEFAEGLLRTLVDIGPRIMADPSDVDLRANLAMAAMLALNGLIGCGVPSDWATHRIGHEITALFGLDHALTLAIVLPHLLRDQQVYKRGKLVQCGERVFGITAGSPEERANATIARIEQFLQQMMGAIRLRDYGITLDDASEIWRRFEVRNWHQGERGNIDGKAVQRILTAAL